jgi:hypothetical protein
MAKIGRRGGFAKSIGSARMRSIPVLEVQSVMSDYFKMIGRKGGRAKSEAKAEAVRENGKLGGRPRKSLKPASNVP